MVSLLWTIAPVLSTCLSTSLSSSQVPLLQHLRFAQDSAAESHQVSFDNGNPWYRWTQGSLNGFPNNNATHVFATDLMAGFMSPNNITQSQLSIARGGNQLLNYAFDWNTNEALNTQPDDVFLLASVSKIYCVAAVQSLLASGKLLSNTPVYSRLGYTSAKDPRVFNITVQNLLEHEGGDDRSISGDPVYMMRNISLETSHGTRPASERDIIEWKLQQMLDYTPGTANPFVYSNYGYLLLSYLVQNITSAPDYYTYLSSAVLEPHDLDVRMWRTSAEYHTSDHVQQVDPGSGPSALDPLSNVTVPFVYGGDGIYKESDMGGAALAASAATLTKTVSLYPVWGWSDGRAPGYSRSGSMAGAYTWVWSRQCDGLDVAVVLNTRDFNTSLVESVLVQSVNQFLDSNGPGTASCSCLSGSGCCCSPGYSCCSLGLGVGGCCSAECC
ncbi:beta-lactamase/transpeptidase-like protein [Setomelanomma holmii]|uniref:Beta-lactamase/transpeptidase-like protein n=1 Tax=Setomelanomma holmii TaxID=210430 RepID=A0A9P4H5V3_9PLEO|nr:beta-lactamase/transpeptidase-like protein [Setomelanomma holmii]